MTESANRPTESDPHFSSPLRLGQTVAGKYVVERELGRGGMGVVFAAHDTLLNRVVALKVLLPGLAVTQTAPQRFTREARAATRISSEHVVKLLDIDALPDGAPVLVMEYLAGRDLRDVLRDDGPLAPRQAVDYLLQALQAVAEGHMHRIVHRDLKPSNLFLTERADGTPLIKVLDFGIAKILELEPSDRFTLTTSEDVRLGSPTYMPPEQLHNPRDVDTRADIWALGITLHELVTGSPPFHGETYAQLVSRIASAAPDSLESKRHDVPVPAGLNEIVTKCLEKAPDNRYQNAGELATALAPFGSDDARLSLSRVTGLTRIRTIPPAPQFAGDSLETCDTTLAVPVDMGLDAPATGNTSGTRRIGPWRRPHSARLVFFCLAGALTIGLLTWRLEHRMRATATATAPKPLAPGPSARVPAPLPTASALPPTQPTATAVVSPVAPVASTPPTDPRKGPVPRNSTHQKRAPAASSDGAPAASPSSAEHFTTIEQDAGELGPSPLIESLIEKRH